LCGKPGRAAALIAVVAIMAFSLFGGMILSHSLENGIRSLEARLGADIAVVPSGCEADYESIILAGSPVNFHIDKSAEQRVLAIAGVEQATTQFYLATLADSFCCTTGIQIVGIDYDTDFVVRPWIAQLLHRNIGDGEVILGSDVTTESGDTIRFYDSVFYVAARLERTATGMDSTVYMNMAAARELARRAQSDGLALSGVDIDNVASTVLLRVGSGYEVDDVISGIRKSGLDVGVVESHGIYSSISSSLSSINGIIRAITLALGVITVMVLMVLFSVITSGRKKEFAILRVLGATRKKLGATVLAEALNISVCGAVLGCLLSTLVVFPFGRNIGMQMGMPLLLPSIIDTVMLLLIGLALSTMVGPLSSAYSAYRISRAETYATMREGE